MKKELINVGYTNKSYKWGKFFFQEKNINGLNHQTNYHELSNFDFVPKLYEDTNEYSKWEWIDGEYLQDMNEENIKNLVRILKILHNSNVKLAKFNLKKRVKTYRDVLNNKNIKIDIINKLYRPINNILKNMNKSTPVHSDLYKVNIIKRHEDQKVFLVDWEYSHMGDKHFELAYIIEAYEFSPMQEKMFLEQYEDYDPYILRKHKVLVNYITVLWLYSQDKLHFSPEICINRLIKLYEEGF